MTHQSTNSEVVSPESTEEGALVGASPVDATSAGEVPLSAQVEPSYSVTQERFEALTGLLLNPKILEVRPQGHRLIVLLNPAPEQHSGLILPEEWRDREKTGSGWVVSVGPLVGTGCPHPGGPLAHPSAMLYRQVVFGSYAGKVLQVEFYDRQMKAPFVVLTDRDIWALNLAPSSHLEE